MLCSRAWFLTLDLGSLVGFVRQQPVRVLFKLLENLEDPVDHLLVEGRSVAVQKDPLPCRKVRFLVLLAFDLKTTDKPWTVITPDLLSAGSPQRLGAPFPSANPVDPPTAFYSPVTNRAPASSN
ncbi:hypothetical protein CRENBAI_015042 [Crenichthys baileyi]|uniref:Uncharacterized protein n=1 Tax=Crenichthys baileyi TaxID=28760 RepID=A0AAV9QZC6_9TELE